MGDGNVLASHPFGVEDEYMNNINERLHTADRLGRLEQMSRSRNHPFTRTPLITATTGPAAPPSVRLENDRKLVDSHGPPATKNHLEELGRAKTAPLRTSPDLLAQQRAIEGLSVLDQQHHTPYHAQQADLPAGSATNLAFSLRRPPPSALESPALLDTIDPLSLFAKLKAERELSENMNVTKFRLQNDFQSSATLSKENNLRNSRARTAPLAPVLTAPLPAPTLPPARVENNSDEEMKGTIIDRTVKRDDLFAFLMGEDAEVDARPKTCQQPKRKSTKGLRPSTAMQSALPLLQMQVRTKVNVKINEDGNIQPETTEMISLFEPDSIASNLEELRLTTVGKCKESDPYPLMPMCQVPPFFLQESSEPIRDRNKDWHLDSERKFLGSDIDESTGRIREEKEKMRAAKLMNLPYDYKPPLPIGTYPSMGHESRELVFSDEAGYLISKELLWRGVVLVSRSYCILSVYGMGIAGRVYAVGLHIPRYILLECYTRDNSAFHQIWVDMPMLEKLFDDRPEMLKPGMKDEM